MIKCIIDSCREFLSGHFFFPDYSFSSNVFIFQFWDSNPRIFKRSLTVKERKISLIFFFERALTGEESLFSIVL